MNQHSFEITKPYILHKTGITLNFVLNYEEMKAHQLEISCCIFMMMIKLLIAILFNIFLIIANHYICISMIKFQFYLLV